MKKITSEEFNSVLVKDGKRSRHPQTVELYNLLNGMEINEAATVSRSEWQRKSPPASVISTLFNGHKTFTCLSFKDESGWVIKRVR